MKKSVAIIGGGTAGLFAAAFLNTDVFDVTIYEKKPSGGRKFLVAGDGGFNLTHSEDIENLVKRYTPNNFLDPALRSFTNKDFINWLEQIGIPTFIGSSKRVFPIKGIKPIQVLSAIVDYLQSRDVHFQFKKEFTGWNNADHIILNKNEIVEADYYIFALGGASWKITGSDGNWLDLFKSKGLSTVPFKAANCAFRIDWPSSFLKSHEGKPLKNIAMSINERNCKGEVVLTSFGIEGNAIYALSDEVQKELEKENIAKVYLDNKPTLKREVIIEKLNNSKWNTSKTLREILKLNAAQIALIKDRMSKEEFLDYEKLATVIKKLPLKVTDSGSIDKAISTTGGIDTAALNTFFKIEGSKNIFTIGEMINWNAPTGGYLIQGCVSMGVFLARYLNLEK